MAPMEKIKKAAGIAHAKVAKPRRWCGAQTRVGKEDWGSLNVRMWESGGRAYCLHRPIGWLRFEVLSDAIG